MNVPGYSEQDELFKIWNFLAKSNNWEARDSTVVGASHSRQSAKDRPPAVAEHNGTHLWQSTNEWMLRRSTTKWVLWHGKRRTQADHYQVNGAPQGWPKRDIDHSITKFPFSFFLLLITLLAPSKRVTIFPFHNPILLWDVRTTLEDDSWETYSSPKSRRRVLIKLCKNWFFIEG